MRRTLLIIAIMTVAVSIFAGDSIPLLGNEYTIKLSNITRVSTVNFSNDNTLVADGTVTITEANGVITLNGTREVNVISLVFPESKEFTVTSGGIFTFKNRFFTLTGRNEKQFIRFDKGGFFLQNDKTVVKISEGVISIRDDEGDRVEISKKGTVIKGDDDQVRLGILGKFISYVVRKAVVHNIDSQKIIADTLTLVAQEEEIDVDVVGGTFNVDIDKGNVSITTDDVKTESTKFEHVKAIDVALVSSKVVMKKTSDASLIVEVKRPKTLPKGYSYSIDHNGSTVIIKEKFNGNVSMSAPVVFTVYIPEPIDSKVKTVSGEIAINGLTTKALLLESVSGEIAVSNVITQKKAEFKTISGMITINEFDGEHSVVSTTSGELLIRKVTGKSLSATVSSGDVTIDDVTIDAVTLKTTSGDISLSNAQIKKVDFVSVSGDLNGVTCTIDEFGGKSTSGDAVFTESKVRRKTFSSISGSFNASLLYDDTEASGS